MNRLRLFLLVLLLVSVGMARAAAAELSGGARSVDGDVVNPAGQEAGSGEADPATPRSSQNLLFLPVTQYLAGEVRGPRMARVSVDSSGRQANGTSTGMDMTPDGRFVVFFSGATNLVLGDTNGVADVFVHDRLTGQTTRVSVSSDGAQGNDNSFGGKISPNGRFVAFTSSATSLVAGDTNTYQDVFVHDRQTGQTSMISRAADGASSNDHSGWADISADGRYVVFHSHASNLVPDDENEKKGVFLHDRQTQQTRLISNSPWDGAFIWGEMPSISFDGRFITFSSGSSIIYLYDRHLSEARVVAHEHLGWNYALVTPYNPAISGDGNFIIYETRVHPDGGPGDDFNVWYRYDRQADVTWNINGTLYPNTPSSSYPFAISPEGRYLAWDDPPLLADLSTGESAEVSINLDGEGASGKSVAVSAGGRIVLFNSEAAGLIVNDTNGVQDVFVRDMVTPDTAGEKAQP